MSVLAEKIYTIWKRFVNVEVISKSLMISRHSSGFKWESVSKIHYYIYQVNKQVHKNFYSKLSLDYLKLMTMHTILYKANYSEMQGTVTNFHLFFCRI